MLPANEKPTPPISVRVTPEERRLLVQRAGDAGLSAYVRHQLFGDGKRARAPRTPRPATRDVAHILALLGESGIAASLTELAHAVSIGALPVMPETEKAIADACTAVTTMRNSLIAALGVGGSDE